MDRMLTKKLPAAQFTRISRRPNSSKAFCTHFLASSCFLTSPLTYDAVTPFDFKLSTELFKTSSLLPVMRTLAPCKPAYKILFESDWKAKQGCNGLNLISDLPGFNLHSDN